MSPVKLTKIVVGKGKTTKPGDAEEWFKTYYELEAEVPEKYTRESVEEVRLQMETMITDWLSEAEVGAVPKLDIAEIDALPWKDRNRQPAKPGSFAWLFGPGSKTGTEAGAEELVKAIKASKDGKLVLGDMEYSLVKQEAFIQRKPVKRK